MVSVTSCTIYCHDSVRVVLAKSVISTVEVSGYIRSRHLMCTNISALGPKGLSAHTNMRNEISYFYIYQTYSVFNS